jgi:hypothetical protein
MIYCSFALGTGTTNVTDPVLKVGLATGTAADESDLTKRILTLPGRGLNDEEGVRINVSPGHAAKYISVLERV